MTLEVVSYDRLDLFLGAAMDEALGRERIWGVGVLWLTPCLGVSDVEDVGQWEVELGSGKMSVQEWPEESPVSHVTWTLSSSLGGSSGLSTTLPSPQQLLLCNGSSSGQ